MITYLQLGRMGRLGNQMFEIAGTIGVARRNGQEFAFPEWKNYDAKERFGAEGVDIQHHFINPLPVLSDAERYRFQERPYYWGYREENLEGNWNLNAHMQSEKFFKNSIDEVRFYFSMHNEVNLPFTAIHWRAGDYETDPDAYHPRLTKEYYLEAMNIIPGPYLVFSDNIQEARALFTPLNHRISFSENDYMDDFRLMKNCKNIICGNSSYSLMAAILADQPGKQVSCPKKWFGPIAGLDTMDLYPENSIVI